MTREEEIVLAGRAREILDNPAWQTLIESRERQILAKLGEYCQDDNAMRQLGYYIKASQQFMDEIQTMVDTGRLAEIQIERE